MTTLVGTFRATRLFFHLICGFSIATVFPGLRPGLRRQILQRWSSGLLRILNVKLTFDPAMMPGSGIIVTNHISWLDVFVLNAMTPMRFVAKSEVRQWPLFGWLCARAQTLFIERGRARDAARINRQVVGLLQEGESLVVFPEGTTTDGKKVGAFHASLLQPAIDACAPVYPVAIRYQDEYGLHSATAAYIDDISFIASLWNILKSKSLHVRLLFTPPITAADSDRRTVTHQARQQIHAALLQMASTHDETESLFPSEAITDYTTA